MDDASSTVIVTVKKWDVFQPKKDVKRPSWFRIDHQMIDDADFFALGHGEFKAWIYTLSQCCRKNSATVTLNFDHAGRVCNVSRNDILGCIKKLTDSGHIEADVTFTNAKVTDAVVKVTDANANDRKRALQTDRRDKTDETRQTLAQASPAPVAWDGYRDAYRERYGQDPLRNAKVNGQLKQFSGRVPAGEVADIAGFYVRHNDAVYVRAGHPVSLLLRDAEKLRTEWITGRRITAIGAKNAESQDYYREQMARIARGEL